jgi:hypothetical protein
MDDKTETTKERFILAGIEAFAPDGFDGTTKPYVTNSQVQT